MRKIVFIAFLGLTLTAKSQDTIRYEIDTCSYFLEEWKATTNPCKLSVIYQSGSSSISKFVFVDEEGIEMTFSLLQSRSNQYWSSCNTYITSLSGKTTYVAMCSDYMDRGTRSRPIKYLMIFVDSFTDDNLSVRYVLNKIE